LDEISNLVIRGLDSSKCLVAVIIGTMSSVLPELGSTRPDGLHSTRSFTRMESPSTSPFARARAKTIQTATTLTAADTEALPLPLSPNRDDLGLGPDVFEKRNSADSELVDISAQDEQDPGHSLSAEDGSEELPIELVSLTDRYNYALPSRGETLLVTSYG
jgi:hypothetical protein